ncbi:MAG: hypothetical protein IH840_14390 [Candidatus Heimdallarchaeota archaeon]|nr:hypothetical protein [Candidatus Heimdallarchaeota archaeon]
MLRGLKLIDTRFQKLSANILLLGDAAVGKTSIKKRYIGHGFRNSYLNTIGFDLIKKTIEFENQVALDAQIWDMGANRKPNRIVRKLLRKVSGALIIFDLTRYETFLKINHWIKLLSFYPRYTSRATMQ